jgi:dynein regulatory complex protein 1
MAQVEDKLQKLLAPLHKDEQSLMKLDSIFKALGVETLDDIQRLTASFIVSHKPNGEDEIIQPTDVVRVLRTFVDSSRKGAAGRPQSASNSDLINSDGEEDGEGEQKNTGYTNGLSSKMQLAREHWGRLANVIPESSFRTWTAVYTAMEKYNAVLNQRFVVSQDIDRIKSQNTELRALLRQYMSAKVNDELQVPPAQILLSEINR